MPHVARRFLAFTSLCTILVLSTAASAEGDDVLLTMPGQWVPVPEPGSPSASVMPVLFGQEIHRPAVRIQPGPGARPAVVASVYEKPMLYGLAPSPGGFQLLAITHVGTPESRVVATLTGSSAPFSYASGLAFDPLGDTLYALLWDYTGYTPLLGTIDAATGQVAGHPIAPTYVNVVGLVFDPIHNRLLAAGSDSNQPTLYELQETWPSSYYLNAFMGLPPTGSSLVMTDLAIDPQNEILYALYWSESSPCRLIEYHLDSGFLCTIDLTGDYATDLYTTVFDPCSGELFFTTRSGSGLYCLDPSHETAPRFVGALDVNGPGALTFAKPESWGLDYAVFDGATWTREQIDNQQDGDWDALSFWGDGRFHTCGVSSDPELGRIDGSSFLYRDGGQPVVAWAQRVDNQFSEILVSAKDLATGEWVAVGQNAYGTPSNKLPGISSTFAFATDPKILLGRVGGQDALVVVWLERFDSPTSTGEVYARYFDEAAGQWLEMGLDGANGDGLTYSGGRVDSFDAAALSASDPAGRRIIVAYSHNTGEVEPVLVKVWDDAFQSWVEFSPGSTNPNTGISNPAAGIMDSHPAIATDHDSGTLFIAWRRQTPGQPWMVMGRQWLGWIINWVDVGYDGRIHRPAQTAATISHPTATFDKQFVVAWEQDLPTEQGKREVLAKVWKDGLWQEIGAGSSSGGGISGSYSLESVYPRLVMDPNLQPVLAWDEGGAAYLRRFDQPLAQAGDCDLDGVPDDQTIANCPPFDKSCADCNKNGVPDGCDLVTGYSQDVNPYNHTPDECEVPMFGDLNCDRVVDTGDIPHFVQALLDPAGYQGTHNGNPYARCEWMQADMNGDSEVDGGDVAAFVDKLLSW
jgi:hypothetical protein